ncbi:MAG TPA: GAF domain-containing sensor histidine kinase [Phototrophicaceae bacterium]|nr:GAF domain-containing sensor histidine kinase [Phototrophicaceae bacterium]
MIYPNHSIKPVVAIISPNEHHRQQLQQLLAAEYQVLAVASLPRPVSLQADLFILDGPLAETAAACAQLRQQPDKNFCTLRLVPAENLKTTLDSEADDYFYHPITPLLQQRVRLLVKAAHGKQTEANERQQRLLAEALRDIAAALNSTLDLEAVLDRILEQVSRVVAHDGANIALMAGETAKVVRCRGFQDAGQILGLEFQVHQTPNHRHMLETHQPIVIPDAQTAAGWITYPGMAWIRADVSAPILFCDEVVGFIHLDSARPQAFTAEDAQNLQAFADQAGIALQNARLYQQLEQLYEEKKDYSNTLEQRVAERTAALLAALHREREISELRSQFISRASHEFRTPLASIMTATDLLHRYQHRLTEAQCQERLEQIQHEVTHLTRLLQDLLTVNNDTALAAFQPSVFDLGVMCQQIIHDLQQTHSAHHTFSFSGAGSDTCVFLDQNRMQEILMNLLSNAIKYSPSGGKIELEIKCSPAQTSLWVRDEGIGIPEADLKHLFEVFHRASNVGSLPGVGLGLALVKQAVEIHGGSIRVESQVGVGSTFEVTIPKHDRRKKEHG